MPRPESMTEEPPTHILPLEDNYADVLNKAQKGLKLTLEELADRSGLSLEAVQALKSGESSPVPDHLEKLAFALHLHPPSLLDLALDRWRPQPVDALPGLAAFTTWYGDMTVNAYLVWDPTTLEAASFDTGASCLAMLDFAQAKKLSLRRIFITHTHPDHLADLARLQQAPPACQAESYGSAAENPLGLKPLVHGDGLVCGALRIRVLGTAGHTPGGLSYFVTGLGRPLALVGDALFAGSMGGAAYAYPEALRNNRERILSLPEDTIIAPGHGPLTTVGEERAHNPFFPELKPPL